MRLFLTVLLISLMVPVAGMAQQSDDSGRTIYNRSLSGNGARLYNAPNSSYGTRGPISLRQMLAGKENAANGSKNSYYGGSNFRPYGTDNNNYSLSLSPDQIRASRARRDAFAQQRERENMKTLQQTAQLDGVEGQTNNFLNKFQSRAVRAPANLGRKDRFKQRKKGFEMPKKVFNSIY